jgi:hypothetical protein
VGWSGLSGGRVDSSAGSLAIFRKLGDRSSQAVSLTNIGTPFGRLGRHDEAIACLQATLTVYRELGDMLG